MQGITVEWKSYTCAGSLTTYCWSSIMKLKINKSAQISESEEWFESGCVLNARSMSPVALLCCSNGSLPFCGYPQLRISIPPQPCFIGTSHLPACWEDVPHYLLLCHLKCGFSWSGTYEICTQRCSLCKVQCLVTARRPSVLWNQGASPSGSQTRPSAKVWGVMALGACPVPLQALVKLILNKIVKKAVKQYDCCTIKPEEYWLCCYW